MMRYTLTLKKVVLPALLMAIAVVGMQLSSCKKKKDSPTSKQVSLANIDFKDTILLTKATSQTYTATNVPQGVTVAYTNNIQQNIGEYFVKATFSLVDGYTWAATEQPTASGQVERNIKLTIADYLTASTAASDGSNGIAIKKAADIYAEVTIPTTLFGYPVVSIDSAAFANNTTINSVKIPEGVTYVGKAFWGCTNLVKVDLPATLKWIAMEAFVQMPTERGKPVSTTLTQVISRATTAPAVNGDWYKYSSNAGEEAWEDPTIFGLNWGANGSPALTVVIYVPDAAKDAYTNTTTPPPAPGAGVWTWAKYSNVIKTFTEGGIN